MTTKAMRNNHLSEIRERGKGHTITGAVIAVIGFFWLAKKVGWIPVAAGGSVVFWPSITLAVGVIIFLSANRNRKEEN